MLFSSQPIRNIFFKIGIVFFCALFVSFLLALLSLRSSIAHEKEIAQQLAQIQAGKIQNTMEAKLYAAEAIALLVKEADGRLSDFDQAAEEILQGYAIDSLSLAPNGVITQTYPLKGNEATIHHDLLQDPERFVEAQQAKDSGKLTISGPYDLRQGIYGVIGRKAVYLSQQDTLQFWGFVCVTLKLPDALQDAELHVLSDQHYTYEISRIIPNTLEKQIIDHQGELGQDTLSTAITLPNSTWSLSLSMPNGWVQPWTIVIRYALALLFAGLLAALYGYIQFLAYSRTHLRISMEQQSENYHRMNQMDEELHSFRHDMKNHFLSLHTLLLQNQIAQAANYLEQISGQLTSSQSITNTENYVFDALLAEKKQIAAQHAINMDCELFLARRLEIDNTDMTILFGNLLDNAIEACTKEGIVNPSIRLQMLCRGNLLHVRMSNTALQAPEIKNGQFLSTKQNPQLHGHGMRHIQSIIKKYHGTMETTYEQGRFTISFMLIEV